MIKRNSRGWKFRRLNLRLVFHSVPCAHEGSSVGDCYPFRNGGMAVYVPGLVRQVIFIRICSISLSFVDFYPLR